MNQWEQGILLGLREDMRNIYHQNNFSLEIRINLASWIEYWTDPGNLLEPNVFVREFHKELQTFVTNLSDADIRILDRQQLMDELKNLKQYENNPSSLLQLIRNCLKEEQRIIGIAMQKDYPYETIHVSKLENIRERLNAFPNSTSDSEPAFIKICQLAFEDIQKTANDIELMSENLPFLVDQWTEKANESLIVIKEIIRDLYYELNCWKQELRRSIVEIVSFSISLNDIETLLNVTAKSLLELFRELKLICEYIQSQCQIFPQIDLLWHRMNSLHYRIRDFLLSLIHNTFVVQTQPGLIVRYKCEIKSSTIALNPRQKDIKVRFLVGPAIFRSDYKCKVKATVLTEVDSYNYNVIGTSPSDNAGKVDSSESLLKLDENLFRASFKGLRLLKRPKSSNNQDSVTSEKYCLVFSSDTIDQDALKEEAKFLFLNVTIPIKLRTISSVFTVASHNYQDADAWPHSFWQNCFLSRQDVSADELLNALDKFFLLKTKRGLSDENKEFLKKKLLGNRLESEIGRSSIWDLFHNEPLHPDCYASPDEMNVITRRKPSISKWLFCILKLCMVHKEWRLGYMEGFISLENMEAKCKEINSSVILIFSNTLLEAITINWFNHSLQKMEKLIPLQPVDLTTVTLSKLILDDPRFNSIYANGKYTKKEVVFSRLPSDKGSENKLELYKLGYIITAVQHNDVDMSYHYNTSGIPGFLEIPISGSFDNPRSVRSFGSNEYSTPSLSPSNSNSAIGFGNMSTPQFPTHESGECCNFNIDFDNCPDAFDYMNIMDSDFSDAATSEPIFYCTRF